MATHHFIAVAGVMGVGKTTACKLLSDAFGYKIIRENVDGNAFLPLYYENPRRWALAVQLFFLRDRIDQLAKIQSLLNKKGVIQDTPIHVDYFTYTRALLSAGTITKQEHALYKSFFDSVQNAIRHPDLIIHLDASPASIVKRIAARGRDFEAKVDINYIKLLSRHQRDWVKRHADSPVLTIRTDALDLASNKSHQNTFIDIVTKRLKKIPA